MIHIIYGEKGSGKTKQIIDSANNSASHAKGIVVYIDKDCNRIHDLNNKIRLVDATSYGIQAQTSILSFIKGMLSANFDIEKIYIDGLAKIVRSTIDEMEVVYNGLEKIADEFSIDFVVTASCAKDALPPFVAKHIN